MSNPITNLPFCFLSHLSGFTRFSRLSCFCCFICCYCWFYCFTHMLSLPLCCRRLYSCLHDNTFSFTLTCPCICSCSLASNWQTALMPSTTICIKFNQTFDVHRNFTSQITFYTISANTINRCQTNDNMFLRRYDDTCYTCCHSITPNSLLLKFSI